MSAIDALRSSLAAVTARLDVPSFGNPTSIVRMVADLERRYGQGRIPDPEIVLKTLRQYLKTRTLNGYREVKNACYGLCVPVHEGRAIASNIETLEPILRYVDAYQAEPRKLHRCFQALLAAYLSLDGCDEQAPSHAQWLALRSRLCTWLPWLETFQPRSDWLDAMFEHHTLLGDDPTGRYGSSVLRGDTMEFDAMCARLNVGATSWVRRRVVISALDAACAEPDAGYLAYLPQMVESLNTNEGVREEGTEKLLDRHARQQTASEHPSLRILAIDVFGNPLVTANRQRWFRVSPAACDMVSNWLKGFLIERFFELLSHDGRTDKRRPEFWVRYRGSIESMWFILGARAMDNNNKDFRDLRRTMGNQCLRLEGSISSNNAFVMKVGKIYVVEFGVKGNAAFLFGQDTPPFDLTKPRLHLNALKSELRLEKMSHMDGHDFWTDKFANTLAHYGVYPDDAPPRSHRSARIPPRVVAVRGVAEPFAFLNTVRRYCNQRGLVYDDRAARDRFIVRTGTVNQAISNQLTQWGFDYDVARCQWVKCL